MDDNLHAVVKLLVQRMESNPEEFSGGGHKEEYINRAEDDRWWRARTLVLDFGTEEEKAAIAAAMRNIKLRVAHEWMMDELFNGDERRREKEEEEARDNAQIATANNSSQQYLGQYATQLQGGLMNQARTTRLPFFSGGIL